MHSQLWYALPLIVVLSLVYAATRHELMRPILMHALRWMASVTGVLAVAMLFLLWLSGSL